MVYFVDGELHAGHRERTGSTFEREPTRFRGTLSPLRPGQLPEKGRYHLIVSAACPWAHRALLLVKQKRLEEFITLSVVQPVRSDDVGWEFGTVEGDGEPLAPTRDLASGKDFRYLYELYLLSDPTYTGNITTPVLFDGAERRIVSNESRDIVRMLDGWVDLGLAPLYPEAMRAEIDKVADDVQDALNNGVYRTGLARSQEAYVSAAESVFACLDRLEGTLESRRYLLGDHLTVADWQLFPTLARFDPVYFSLFKCCRRRLSSYRNLSAYLREMYQMDGVAATVSFPQIRQHYFTTFDSANPARIVFVGDDYDAALRRPHERDRLAPSAPEAEPAGAVKGEFKRGVSRFRASIEPEDVRPGRYHLYVANNCPWCHRALLARAILGLEDCVTVDVCFYRRDPERGWQFLPPDEELRDYELRERATLLDGVVSKRDRVFGFHFVREVYEREGSSEKSVPVLLDTETKTIVNNESSEIIRIFNSAFKAFHREGAPDLYPTAKAAEIEGLNAFIYPDINNGAYRAGFSTSQEAYDVAFEKYFAALDRINELLETRRFLTGDSATEADVRLLPTMVRHDPVYFVRMRLNKKMVLDYPHLSRWFADMVRLPGVVSATNLAHCIHGYFGRSGNSLIPVPLQPFWY